MSWNEVFAQNAAYNQGRADEAGCAAQQRAAQPGFDPKKYAGGVEVVRAQRLARENEALQEQVQTLRDQVLEMKQRLYAARAVRDALRQVLAAVAPDHALVNPFEKNPYLIKISGEAMDRALKEETGKL